MGQVLRFRCPSCSGGGEVSLGQTVIGGKLRWHRSIICSKCGQTEEDGIGIPPPEVRDEFIKREGAWRLIVDTGKRVVALKVLKITLALSMEEVVSTSRLFPVVYEGTKTEVEWLQELMTSAGVQATGVPASA